jgi:hypothetical protein
MAMALKKRVFPFFSSLWLLSEIATELPPSIIADIGNSRNIVLVDSEITLCPYQSYFVSLQLESIFFKSKQL